MPSISGPSITASEQQEFREGGRDRSKARPTVSIEDARANRFDGGWDEYTPPKPKVEGLKPIDDVSVKDLVPYIDWTPFFWTWEMKGKFPHILQHNEKGPAARELYEAATAMLDRIVEEQWFRPRGVIGLWPANAVGDDIRVWADEGRDKELTTFRMLRQQQDKSGKRPNYCLTDFVAPEGVADWIGGFAVTSGSQVHEISERFKKAGNDYDAIMVQALADRLAEAFAEYMHSRVRRELWGYAPDEDFSAEELIDEKYRGIRPAAGYPACPDHTEKRTLFDLLSAEKNTGIELTESFAMWPAPSVSGLYFSHPKSAYFGVGRIGRDQVEDYAERKGMPVAEVEKWLAPNLAYEPKREAEPEPEIELRRSA